MKTRVWMLLCILLLSGGCTSFRTLERDVRLDTNDESIFIIGVSPGNYRITVFPGSVVDGMFHPSKLSLAAVYGAPVDGYVVGKAAAGETLAITRIRVVSDQSDYSGLDFGACEGQKALVFDVPPGKVIYLADVRYIFGGSSLSAQYSRRPDAARRYLDRAYPNLKGRLEQGDFSFVPVDAPCVQ